MIDKTGAGSLQKRDFYSNLFVKYNVVPVRGIFQFNMYVKKINRTSRFKVREHTYETRLTDRENYYFDLPRNKFGSRNLAYLLPRFWNYLPDEIFLLKNKNNLIRWSKIG